MLYDQPSGIGAVAAGIPTQRRGSCYLLECRDGLGQMGTLSGLIGELIADPAQAVARNLVSELAVGSGSFRVTLQCHSRRENRKRGLAPLESPQHTPHSRTRPILEERFHAHM